MRRISRATSGEAEFEGCAEKEIEEIMRMNSTFTPDEDYVHFMRTAGRWCGSLFMGTDIYYPGCLLAREGIEEFFPADELDDIFAFGHHQGYQIYFFRRGDPSVRLRSEGELEEGDQVVAPSFFDFVSSELDRHIRFLERAWGDSRYNIPVRRSGGGVYFDSTNER